MKTDINSSDIIITVDGEVQQESKDYTIENNRWQFTYPPEPGAIVKVYKRKEDAKTTN